MIRAARMKKELEMLQKPPPGIACWAAEGGDRLDRLEARIIGPEDTPYVNGVFKLEISVPEQYPIQPPNVRFVTKIYHPNIDGEGRICLDLLKLPPKGSWKPNLNISALLNSILVLLREPNPKDPLMADIAEEYEYRRDQFSAMAKEYTMKYASQAAATGDDKET